MSLNSLRLSLEGLRRPDAAALTLLLDAGAGSAGQLWEVTAAGDAQAVVVDPEADEATQALRERPFGALIIWVLRAGETAWPGTLSIARPFDVGQAQVTLHVAAQLAMQPDFGRPLDTVALAPDADPEFVLSPEPPVSDVDLTVIEDSLPDVEDAAFDSDEPRALSLLDMALDATFDEPVLLNASPEPDEPALLSPSAAAMESAIEPSWDTRELTLVEALAELTPTSVPPVNWMDTLMDVEALAPADAPEAEPVQPIDEIQELREAIGDAVEPDDVIADVLEADAVEPDDGSEVDTLIAEGIPEQVAEEMAEVRLSIAPGAGVEVEEDTSEAAGRTTEIDSLAGLAAAYREQLYREREVLVQVEDLSFHLLPYQGLCVSNAHPEQLQRYRGRQPLGIDIDVVVTEPDERLGESSNLVHFLWHLGVNAGGGRLLPWIPVDLPCRLTRWPPIAKQDEHSQLFRAAAVLSRTPTPIADLVQLAGAAEAEVNDFLNGCSLLGYLEVLPSLASRAVSRGVVPASTTGTSARSLVGRLRQRIGLHQ